MKNTVPAVITATNLTELRLQHQTRRTLSRIEHGTIVQVAAVRAEGVVQGEKLDEIDHLTRQAMTGQAMLHRWGAALASGDPFVADDLRFFTDVAKLGKGEVIVDTIASYSRGGR